MFFRTLKTLILLAFIVTTSSCTLSLLPSDANNNNSTVTAFEYDASKSDISGGPSTLWYYGAVGVDSAISDQFATAETYVLAVDGAVDTDVDHVFLVFNSDYTSAILYVYLVSKDVVRVMATDWVISGRTVSSTSLHFAGTATFGADREYFTVTGI